MFRWQRPMQGRCPIQRNRSSQAGPPSSQNGTGQQREIRAVTYKAQGLLAWAAHVLEFSLQAVPAADMLKHELQRLTFAKGKTLIKPARGNRCGVHYSRMP